MTRTEKKLKAIDPYKPGVTRHGIITGLYGIIRELDRRLIKIEGKLKDLRKRK